MQFPTISFFSAALCILVQEKNVEDAAKTFCLHKRKQSMNLALSIPPPSAHLFINYQLHLTKGLP